MRRTLVLLAAGIAVLATTPAVALAHHHSRHFRHHHHASRVHHARRAHHARIRHRRFGRDQTLSGSGPEQAAGTVASFDNGVLTITLNDGSTVSGAVTGDTKLECTSSSTGTQGEDGNGDGNNGQNSGDDGSSSNDQPSGSQVGDNGSGGNDGSGDDQAEDAQMCSTSALSPGTAVSEADLKITNAGAIWQEVDLITS